jgi:EmrB/QacA subfamily drug resistance transporter
VPDSPHPRRWWILAAVLIGTLVGTLGSSMVNVALPAIMDAFSIEVNSAVWLLTVYVLCVAVLMPIFGRLGDMYGYKRIYVTGISLLGLSCLLAAASRWFGLLMFARVLQGIGNATSLPSIMAIVTQVFPDRERGRALGFWAAMNGVAHGLGPVLGGNLTQYFGWPAVFVVLGGLGLAGAVAIRRLAPDDARHAARRFDVVGALTMTLAALTLMLNLTQGVKLGWTSTLSLGLWVTFAGLLTAFLLAERRIELPFVELGLFANRRYAAATGIISAQFFCLFGMQLLLPLFLVRVQGLSTGQAGLLIAPLAITAALVAPLAGRLSDALGCRPPCTFGMGLVALAGVGLTFWQATTPPWQVVATLILLGLGMGLTQSPVAAAVTSVVDKERLGVALGIFNMFRFISASLGSTVFGVVLQGAAPVGSLASYRLDFYLLIAVALLAVVLALSLPGPVSSHVVSMEKE